MMLELIKRENIRISFYEKLKLCYYDTNERLKMLYLLVYEK